MDSAACAEYPGDMWFAENGGTDRLENARRICETCPVQQACLQHALNNNEPHGMWGGKTSRQRKAIRHNEHERRRQLKAQREAS
ncbi:WhiB family transcriptional regulator [Agromyces lapidis]